MGNVNQDWKDRWGSEWEYVCKLGSAIHDPHAKREFWENIKQLKTENPAFSIYTLFPRSECATKKAMHECMDFVNSLRKPKEEEPVKEERSELQELLGKLIDEGKHRGESA